MMTATHNSSCNVRGRVQVSKPASPEAMPSVRTGFALTGWTSIYGISSYESLDLAK